MEIKDLTLEEKLTLLSGFECWYLNRLGGKLPCVTFSDGPHGVKLNRKETEVTWDKAIAFPTLSALASTFDPALAYEMGELLGEEGIERGVDVLLAPGVNIKRSPYCGRNFEYFSEDPYLAGELAFAYIEGVQSKGIGACVKHFAANNRERDRFYQSSEVDDRTLRELYLPAFRRALEAEPRAVMCAYNLLNGVYCSEHPKLLKKILREEFGFRGVVISDWGAVADRAKALKATLDLEMPHSPRAFRNLKDAYERGFLTEEEIDASVRRLLALLDQTRESKSKRTIRHTREERHALAVKIAEEGAVLLKNDGSLPLNRGERVAVLGKKAKTGVFGGGGSSRVDSAFSPRPLDELLRERGVDAEYRETCFHDWGNLYGFFDLRGGLEAAAAAEKTIVAVGFDETTDCEGADRTSLRLNPVEEELIKRAAAVGKKTIVLVYGGSVVDMSPWIDAVDAVLFTDFNGEGGNEAIANVLAGAEPGGRLQESFPFERDERDECGNGYTEPYREGVFMGYRGYDFRGEEVLFPFGYGLSYAEFDYSDLTVERAGEEFLVSLWVENRSAREGKEVVQLYLGQEHPLISRPLRELKRFEKIALKGGEKKKVSFRLDRRDFAYWSPALDDWRAEEGRYVLSVGRSSRDLRLFKELELTLSRDEPTRRNENV